jgi:hypothetical protein
MADLQIMDSTILVTNIGATAYSTPHKNLLVNSFPTDDDTVVVKRSRINKMLLLLELVFEWITNCSKK